MTSAAEASTPALADSPRGGVDRALRGTPSGAVPVTAMRSRIVSSDVERQLRNAGLCLIAPSIRPYQVHFDNIEQERVYLPSEEGDLLEQTKWRVEGGELTTIVRHSRDRRASYTMQRLFRSPADYDPLIEWLAGQRFEPDHAAYEAFEEQFGSDVFVRLNLGYTPMNYVMHQLMGLDRFAEEWSHRREKVLALYQAVMECHHRRLSVAIESPVRAITYGGSLNAHEVGLDRFKRYYLPQFQEFADWVHGHNKLAGLHLSGDPRPLADELSKTKADYIEGFRPSPAMGIAGARRAWPDITLWVEMPADAASGPPEETTGWVREVLMNGKGDRVLLEIGAALPATGARDTLLAIYEAMQAEMGG